MMQKLRAFINRHLDRISYYFTIYAVGLAGLLLTWQMYGPHVLWQTVLILAYMAISSLSLSPRINEHHWRVHALLVLQTALVVILVLLTPEMSFFIIWFYLQTVYALIVLPMRQALFWMGLFIVGELGLLIYAYGWLDGLATAAIYGSGFVFFWAFAQMTLRAHKARDESQRLLQELQQAHQALRAYARKAEALAIAEERNRMAREMHDTLGHRLTVAAVQLEAAERLIPSQPQRAAEMMKVVGGQIRAALAELRQTVAALRQSALDDLPLEQALPRLVDDFQQATGLQVILEMPASLPPLTPQQRLALFRAAQEGLTNAHKHAGASCLWLEVQVTQEQIALRVCDDGRGPQGERNGFGLRGLAERAAQLGGQLQFGPRPQGGSTLEMNLPLTLPTEKETV